MPRLKAWLAAALAATLLGACDAPQGPTISGTLTMPEALQAKLGESDTLFIVARPAGEKEAAPVAIKRYVGVTFPLDYTFDAQDIMIPGQTLSVEVEVKASIHKSGLANVRVPGDMQGAYEKPVKPGADDVDFAIDEVIE